MIVLECPKCGAAIKTTVVYVNGAAIPLCIKCTRRYFEILGCPSCGYTVNRTVDNRLS